MTWREHLTLLHLPTTSALLSLAVLGSLFAQETYLDRLVLFLLQVFLGGSVAANHFDELVNRPWHTKMPRRRLWLVAIAGLSAFATIGLYLTVKVSYNFIFFVVVESFCILVYDLELFGGVFHNSKTIGAGSGLVFLGGYYLQEQVLSPLVVIVTLIVSAHGMRGIKLYERGRSFGKDRNLADPQAKFAWERLRRGILAVDAATVAVVAYRFWPFT